MRRAILGALWPAALAFCSCGSSGPPAAPDGGGADGPDAASRGAGPPSRGEAAPEPDRVAPEIPDHPAGAMVAVPAGVVLAGSTPGTPGRVPELEMDGEELRVGAFEIDALPYPNDPASPPLVGRPRDRAAELCASAGKRLCHELEWERACEGEDGRAYPYGEEHEPARYGEPRRVSSPFGVLAMGTVPEWTASDWPEPVGGRKGAAGVVRGPAAGEASAAGRRCATRRGVLSGDEVGAAFRCCRGEEPGPELAYLVAGATFPFDRQEDLGAREAFQAMIRSVPELRELHDDPQPFSQEDVFGLMHESGRSGPKATAGTWYTWLPVRWIPRQGEEIIVAAGADGQDTFVVALYELPGGRYRHAASYVFLGTSRAIVLSYTRDRRYVHWNPCLDCRDGGLVSYEDGRVRISQRW